MDPSRTTDQHTLRRIVAVLLGLAELAERAAGRPAAVRCLVLWLLRSGEVLARRHLTGLKRHAVGPCQPVSLTGDNAGEAMRLASSFRQFAAALTELAAGLASPRQAVPARYGSPLLVKPAATGPLPLRGGSTPTVCRLDSS